MCPLSNQVVGSRIARHSRFKPSLSDFFIDAVSATVDSTVLRGHDSLERTFTLYVTCKRGNLRNDYDDLYNVHASDDDLNTAADTCLEFRSRACSAKNPLDKSGGNLVLHGPRFLRIRYARGED